MQINYNIINYKFIPTYTIRLNVAKSIKTMGGEIHFNIVAVPQSLLDSTDMLTILRLKAFYKEHAPVYTLPVLAYTTT